MVQRSTSINIKIRKAYREDLEGLVRLRKVFGESNRTVAYYDWKLFLNPLGEGKIWVAEDNDRIIGMRTLAPKGNDIYETGDTYIHPDYQGRGIITKMLDDGEQYFAYGVPNDKIIRCYLRVGYTLAPIELRSYVGFRIGSKAESGLPDTIPNDPNFLIGKTYDYLKWRYGDNKYSFWKTDGGYSVTRGNKLVDYATVGGEAFKRLLGSGVVRTWAIKGSIYDKVLLRAGFVPLHKIPVIHKGLAGRWYLTWGDTDNI